MICGSGWPGNFPGHHVLTCMTQKNEIWIKSTQHMCQGPQNTCMQLNQKQTLPKSITKLAQTINSDTCNFLQKHSDTNSGLLISSKKIKRTTKHVKNQVQTQKNVHRVQAKAEAQQKQHRTIPTDTIRQLQFFAETQ